MKIKYIGDWKSARPKERNAFVAEKVMGWKYLERPVNCVQKAEWDSFRWPVLSAPGTGYCESIPPDYSRSDKAALEILGQFRTWGIHRDSTGRYEANIMGNVGCSGSLAEAICLAALRTVFLGD